jgi:hypothetical protein
LVSALRPMAKEPEESRISDGIRMHHDRRSTLRPLNDKPAKEGMRRAPPARARLARGARLDPVGRGRGARGTQPAGASMSQVHAWREDDANGRERRTSNWLGNHRRVGLRGRREDGARSQKKKGQEGLGIGRRKRRGGQMRVVREDGWAMFHAILRRKQKKRRKCIPCPRLSLRASEHVAGCREVFGPGRPKA